MRRLAALSLLTVACIVGEDTTDELNPDRLTDQSGAVFAWDCSDYSGCELRRIDGSPPLPDCDGLRPWFGYSWYRFLSIDGACVPYGSGSWHFESGWGRKVVCETDADCPQLVFFSDPDEFECRAGFCQSTDLAAFPADELPDRWDMFNLCVGAARREDGYDATDELKAALDAACPGDDPSQPCESVPPGCPDTRG